ncbi:MAG: hypothetical protein RLZZ393_987 [Pseudomonadota bacterium]|jgi:hypothetical protein
MKIRILSCAVALFGLVACATDIARRPASPAINYLDYAGPEVESFHYVRLDGWEVVSRDQILVWTGLQEAYLLKVWEPCTELQYALAIGFTSRFNHVSRFDKLRAGRDICPIGEIRRVDTARLKADRRKQRAQPGAARPGN